MFPALPLSNILNKFKMNKALNKLKFKTRFRLCLFTSMVVNWLIADFNLELIRSRADFLGLVRALENIEQCNGQVTLTKYCKAARLALSRYLAGQPFKSKEVDGVKLTVDGIPTILKP